jgi:membrane protease YdiL (CAAX protease family)
MSEEAAEYGSAQDWRAKLAGTGPVGVSGVLVVSLGMILLTPIIGSILVLIWARVARVPFSEIGFVRPPSWLRSVVYGVLLGVGLKLVMKALVLPALGVEAVNQQFHFVQGNPQAALGLAAYGLVAAFTEETFFRGYLFERIGARLGKEWLGATAAVLISSAVFGILHFQQGRLGITNATIVGLVSGGVYLANKRRLFLLMVAHATFDIASFVIIYLGLEQTLGTLIFHGVK